MADEKIVVVCDEECECCDLRFTTDDGVECPISRISTRYYISKGDVVTIEIKRNKDLTK